MARVALLSALFALQASAQVQSRWGQCGGDNYDGPTVCPGEFICTVESRWFAQCVPEEDAVQQPVQTTSFQTIVTITVTRERIPVPTAVTTYITFVTDDPIPISTPPPVLPPDPTPEPLPTGHDTTITAVPDTPITDLSPRAAATAEPQLPHRRRLERNKQRAVGPEKRQGGTPTPSELQDGALWVRAVTDPHFHDYLQTNPANLPGVAILGPRSSAGQFNVVAGQLVSLGDPSLPLYLHVERPADLASPPRTLATTFNETESDFGQFVFNGDALTWSVEGMRRENQAAWLVCGGDELFINTGAYGYMTPAGCSDHTIHYYNGARAD
ncbi:uncharacterized protein DNG_01466 [Cephalotrichum gorgonifer]|uniref:CBM1 domain-containing protein n=1 Tax=Cephalotrichum gorgonifer TaxID=2041049 RepID=A0AAE8MR69_9PEZI|nr:uncharacterized protein DNG_01466 [Cephalotrichum gorgonifer]